MAVGNAIYNRTKAKFTQAFSNTPAINWLSASRFFLFGSRDVWFVVGLPVFLYEVPGWSFTEVGGFIALWVIGYGFVQAVALALIPAGIALDLAKGFEPEIVIIGGLLLFGAVFAINSSVHSYLILAYSDHDKVSMNVGFYYVGNAGGRLAGTVLSGLIYQTQGLEGCLWWSSGFLVAAGLLSIKLPAK